MDEPENATDPAEVAAMRRELALLRTRVARMGRDLDSLKPLIAAARGLEPWDFTPYRVQPDGDWIAVERERVERLLAALAAVDHWAPWSTRIEPRAGL